MFLLINGSCHLCLSALEAVSEQKANDFEGKALSGHSLDVHGKQVGHLAKRHLEKAYLGSVSTSLNLTRPLSH